MPLSRHSSRWRDGGCDKVLGPSQVKGMSILVMLDMIELFGARLGHPGECRNRSEDAGPMGTPQ